MAISFDFSEAVQFWSLDFDDVLISWVQFLSSM